MDHSAGLQVGMVEISVLPSKRARLVEDLTERGWKVIL
jgi:prephenate dehydrogenase